MDSACAAVSRPRCFPFCDVDIKLQHTVCVTGEVTVFHTQDLQLILFALYTVYYIIRIDFHRVLFSSRHLTSRLFYVHINYLVFVLYII